MTPDDLDTKSLEELDRIFVAEISKDEWQPWSPSRGAFAPPYSSSADAVLLWLKKWWTADPDYRTVSVALAHDGYWHVELRGLEEGQQYGKATTFPHAAVKALIRAERAKKQSNA